MVEATCQWLEVVAMTTATTTVSTTGEAARRRERHNLVRHFVEMVLAMIVGMAGLGAVVRGICAVLGHPGFFLDHPGLRAPLMAMNMAIGMAAWMRHRGHRWAPIAEMSAAMFVPVAVLIGPFWAGTLSGDALLGAMHILMLPAMVIAMRHRRDEYAQDHHRQLPAFPTPSAAYKRASVVPEPTEGGGATNARVAGGAERDVVAARWLHGEGLA
jgi:hypothetical protein